MDSHARIDAVTNGLLISGTVPGVLGQGTLHIENGRIAEVDTHAKTRNSKASDGNVIDATGCVVFPGTINLHAHGVSPGPLYPSAAQPLDDAGWTGQLDRQLLAGTTAVLNLCGFATAADIRRADEGHPVRVFGATSALPLSTEAARKMDGQGLTDPVASGTTELGNREIVAIGEIGGGHTLGGAGQDYLYIPQAVKAATGVDIDVSQARSLKYAALGRHIKPDQYDQDAMARALSEANLASALSPEEARRIVEQTVLPSVETALDGFDEAIGTANEHHVPVIYHNAAASADRLHEVVKTNGSNGGQIIGGHTNHPTFTANECVRSAELLKEYGCLVEVSTLDSFGGRRIVPTPENIDRLVDGGLVDIVATDFAGGNWDSVLDGVSYLINTRGVAMDTAVAMATGNAVAAIPEAFSDCGTLTSGKYADIVIADRTDLSKIRDVIVEGTAVVRDGNFAMSD